MNARYVRHYRDATNAFLVVSVQEILLGVVTPTTYTGSILLSSIPGLTDLQILQNLFAACKVVRDASATKTTELAAATIALRHDQAMAFYAASDGRDLP